MLEVDLETSCRSISVELDDSDWSDQIRDIVAAAAAIAIWEAVGFSPPPRLTEAMFDAVLDTTGSSHKGLGFFETRS